MPVRGRSASSVSSELGERLPGPILLDSAAEVKSISTKQDVTTRSNPTTELRRLARHDVDAISDGDDDTSHAYKLERPLEVSVLAMNTIRNECIM